MKDHIRHGSADSRLRRDARLPHNPAVPSNLSISQLPSPTSPTVESVNGRRRYRLFAMASRARAATVSERPNNSYTPQQQLQLQQLRPLRPFDPKRMSRDDMDLGRPRRAQYDKRVSRDDLSLMTRQFDKSTHKSYHIPIRGKPPTPETSPGKHTPESLIVRTTTPESMDRSDMGVIAIGMALGSPAHPPELWTSAPPAPHSNSPALPPPQVHPSVTTNITASPQEAQKPRKWGFFSRSKSKRGRSQDSGLQVPKTTPAKLSKHTPIIAQTPPVPTNRFLDIDIPDTTMERYSVMFEGVLEQRRASSLLARRQATLDRLKNVRDCVTQEVEREKENQQVEDEWPRPQMTSNRPAPSPSFNLFPSTPSRTNLNSSTSNLSIKPLSRSATSPAMIPSPSEASFPRASKSKTFPRQQPMATRPQDSPMAGSVMSSESLTPTILSPDVHIRDKLQPVVQSPVWQMVTPPASTASVSTVSQHKARQSSISSENMSVVPINSRGSEESEAQKALDDAVEISIARQISISQQQRQMLRPLKTTVSVRRKDPSPQGVGIAGANVKLGSKSLTPTLIHPTYPSDVINSPKRKSSRGILDGHVIAEPISGQAIRSRTDLHRA